MPAWNPEAELQLAAVPRVLGPRPGMWMKRWGFIFPAIALSMLVYAFRTFLSPLMTLISILIFTPALLVAVAVPLVKNARVRRILQRGTVVRGSIERTGKSLRGYWDILVSFEWKGQKQTVPLSVYGEPEGVTPGTYMTCLVAEDNPEHLVLYALAPYKVKTHF